VSPADPPAAANTTSARSARSSNVYACRVFRPGLSSHLLLQGGALEFEQLQRPLHHLASMHGEPAAHPQPSVTSPLPMSFAGGWRCARTVSWRATWPASDAPVSIEADVAPTPPPLACLNTRFYCITGAVPREQWLVMPGGTATPLGCSPHLHGSRAGGPTDRQYQGSAMCCRMRWEPLHTAAGCVGGPALRG
jgi:hypothetical protein